MAESVWDYPRPPRIEPTERRIRVVLGGETIVDTRSALRVLETSHPPVYYVPRDEIADGAVLPAGGRTTFCEWKGTASYFDVVGGAKRVERGAWTYPVPLPGCEAIRDRVAFYPAPMDACFVDDEQVEAQADAYYGGWITSDVTLEPDSR